jgi:hypothetical protein
MSKNYLIIDTETANGLDSPLVYDYGGIIVNNKGEILECFSFVNTDVFYGKRDLMQTCYYHEKIPMYEKELFNGKRTAATFAQIYNYTNHLLKKYDIKAVLAYNMRFDQTALNNTLQTLTNGKKKYFFPYGLDKQCIMCMAQDTICKQKTYKKFCLNNGYLTPRGRLKTTAEAVYRYINLSTEFAEEHTGLADVMIEWKIWEKVKRQKKKMRRHYWDKAVI